VTNLNMSIDLRSGVPAYIQIIENIQRLAGNGDLKPGDQLPTVRQMAAELRVNHNTVARAYRLLDEAGVISTQHGRGTYLVEQPSEDSRQKLRQEVLENIVRRFMEELDRCGFNAQEAVTEIDARIRTAESSSLENDEIESSKG
jgi:GntR family transcriptional regulator